MNARSALALAAVWVSACGASRSKVSGAGGSGGHGTAGSGGAAATGGSAGNAGASAGRSAGGTAGASAPLGGAAGTSAGAPQGGSTGGGGAGSGGVSGDGGASSGASGDPAGEGGEPSNAGSGGNAGQGGSAGQGGTAPDPSPGCNGNAHPETQLEHYDLTEVQLPPGYDGITPFPMLLGFHETNVPGQILSRFKVPHPAGERYVIVQPEKRNGVGTFEGLSPDTVIPLLDDVLANFCIDRRNLHAVGQGSGARFLGTVLCKGRAIASVPEVHFSAAALLGAYGRSGCSTWPAIPLLFVHGLDAAESRVLQDADGMLALAKFQTTNGCGATSVPHPQATCTSQNTTVMPACVDYEGCSEPLRFCSHNDPIQTNSGWPCFGADAVYEFLDGNLNR